METLRWDEMAFQPWRERGPIQCTTNFRFPGTGEPPFLSTTYSSRRGSLPGPSRRLTFASSIRSISSPGSRSQLSLRSLSSTSRVLSTWLRTTSSGPHVLPTTPTPTGLLLWWSRSRLWGQRCRRWYLRWSPRCVGMLLLSRYALLDRRGGDFLPRRGIHDELRMNFKPSLSWFTIRNMSQSFLLSNILGSAMIICTFCLVVRSFSCIDF